MHELKLTSKLRCNEIAGRNAELRITSCKACVLQPRHFLVDGKHERGVKEEEREKVLRRERESHTERLSNRYTHKHNMIEGLGPKVVILVIVTVQ